jgi:Protein of unknown function (DUF4239)
MYMLGNLPVAIQAATVAILFAAVTVAGLYFVRRRIPPHILKGDHDVAGFTFGVVGAFYGVVLAFVIVAVWQRFERANELTQREALALSNLYDLSKGLDEPVRSAMQQALREYATEVIDHEWKAMATYSYRRSGGGERRIWQVLANYNPSGIRQQTFLDKSIDQLGQLSDARQLRYLYSSENLPAVIWIVIYVGCLITLGFGYFFVTQSFRSQAIMIATFAALMGLTILAISELANPYQGTMVVSEAPFRYALSAMVPQAPAPPPATR